MKKNIGIFLPKVDIENLYVEFFIAESKTEPTDYFQT